MPRLQTVWAGKKELPIIKNGAILSSSIVCPTGPKYAPNTAWARTSSPRTIQVLEGRQFPSGVYIDGHRVPHALSPEKEINPLPPSYHSGVSFRKLAAFRPTHRQIRPTDSAQIRPASSSNCGRALVETRYLLHQSVTTTSSVRKLNWNHRSLGLGAVIPVRLALGCGFIGSIQLMAYLQFQADVS